MTRLLCDVDGVVAPTLDGWIDDMKSVCISFDEEKYENDKNSGKIDYDLSNYFEFDPGYDPFSWYWNIHGLYDNLIPIQGSQDVLNNINTPLIFLSGWMDISKNRFCKMHYSPLGCIGTEEKWLVVEEDDIFIDDRLSNFYNHSNPGAPVLHKCRMNILFDRGYEQEFDVDDSIKVCKNWSEVKQLLIKEGIWNNRNL